jgi:hypothetical protein
VALAVFAARVLSPQSARIAVLTLHPFVGGRAEPDACHEDILPRHLIDHSVAILMETNSPGIRIPAELNGVCWRRPIFAKLLNQICRIKTGCVVQFAE